MTETRSTKRALLASVVALMLCIAMLLGTTYAWFTDNASSMNNMIKSGNLDIELEYLVDAEKDVWAPVTEDTPLFNETALWEPGHVEAVALRVKNVGTLAAKYDLSTSIYLEKEGTNVYGETFKLSDYLEVEGIIMDAATGSFLLPHYLSDRDVDGLYAQDFNVPIVNEGNENAVLKLEPNASALAVIRITMPTTVDNVANYKTGTQAPYIQFGVNMYATQVEHEADSFGTDYDEDAKIEDVKFPVAEVTDNGPVEDLYVESLFGGGLFDENNNEHLRDMDATFTFKAPVGETAYDEWIADYEVVVDTDLEDKAAVLAGQYDFIDEDWQAFYTPAVKANEPTRLLASQNFYLTYKDVRDYVGEFQCGVENLNVPEGTTMTVALKLYKQDADNNVLDSHTVGVFKYTF